MKIVKKITLYWHLCELGYEPIKIAPHPDDPKRRMWIYDDSEQLGKDIQAFWDKVNEDKKNKDDNK